MVFHINVGRFLFVKDMVVVKNIQHFYKVLWYASIVLCLCVLTPPLAHAAKTSHAVQLNGLIKEYDLLSKDAKKSSLRHHWERLDGQFTRLSKASSGDVRVKSAFYSARSKHSLAEKSFNRGDFTAASDAYLRLVSSSPKHSLASESLYRAAYIQGTYLKNSAVGKQLGERLLREYPQSAQAGKARNLLARLSKTPPSSDKGRGGTQASSMKTRVEQLGLTVKTIMIDPGHGGKDPGTEGNGIRERDLTLSFAKILGQELKNAGYTVLYTRTSNTFLALNKRTELANAKKADLFLSIHVNSNKNANIHGLETYYLDEANSDSAKKVAARENSVSMSKVSDVQFILTDLMLNSKLKESRALATNVHRGILGELRNRKISFKDNKVRPAPFYVLMGARMPGVLVELGYASNRNDAKRLKNTAFLKHQARGIVQGISSYKKEVAKEIF